MRARVPRAWVERQRKSKKDKAQLLYNGQWVGDGSAIEVDVAVVQLDGTRLTARGMGNALAVVDVSPRGTMFDPGPSFYMEKIACGPESVDAIDLDAPAGENVKRVA